MKKLLVAVLALFFVTATSNLVLADTAPTTSPAVKTVKASHKGKHHKKGKRSLPTKPSSAPAQ